MARITRSFVEGRLVTTTKNLRETGILAPQESLAFRSTGHDRLPWQLSVVDATGDGTRIIRDWSTNVTWSGLNTAVDAVYELSWHATARGVERPYQNRD